MELTNGGKPHMHDKIAVHDSGTSDALYVCAVCRMPVDKPKEDCPFGHTSPQKWCGGCFKVNGYKK